MIDATEARQIAKKKKEEEFEINNGAIIEQINELINKEAKKGNTSLVYKIKRNNASDVHAFLIQRGYSVTQNNISSGKQIISLRVNW